MPGIARWPALSPLLQLPRAVYILRLTLPGVSPETAGSILFCFFAVQIKESSMFTVSFLSLVMAAAAPAPEQGWLNNYEKATERALKEKKDLFIVFEEKGELKDVLGDAQV